MASMARIALNTALVSVLIPGLVATSSAGLLDSGFEASYEVYYSEFYLGDTVRTFQKQGDNSWVYKANTRPRGIASAFVSDRINEVSKLRKMNNRFQPLSYDYHQHGGKEETVFRLEFDWKAKQILNSYTEQDVPLQDETHDLLSFQIQLMQDLQDGKKSISYVIADKKHADRYQLTKAGNEKVETPMKTFNAIKLVSSKTRSKQQFIIWAAPELNYLPVKVMKIDRKGRESAVALKSIRFN